MSACSHAARPILVALSLTLIAGCYEISTQSHAKTSAPAASPAGATAIGGSSRADPSHVTTLDVEDADHGAYLSRIAR